MEYSNFKGKLILGFHCVLLCFSFKVLFSRWKLTVALCLSRLSFYVFISLSLIRPHEAGGAGGSIALPIFFNTELCPISSAHKNILEILDDNSGCCTLLQAINGFIVLQFFGQGNPTYSSYHRNWTALVSPQYFGLEIDLNCRIRCLCIYFVP